MKMTKNTLRKGTKLCTKGTSKQIQKDFDEVSDLSCIDVRSSSGKSRVMSGPSCMAAMLSNNRCKPRD